MSGNCDIVFNNLCYTVKRGFFKKSSKEVLKSISGRFKSSELTAVIGPSGCGKSSLLNILSGYISKNVSGSIEVKDTRKRSYIMQEENLHILLTVLESMMFSINVKTGFNSEKVAEKKLKVNTVLANLGLADKINSYVRDLSGGQLKRLSIAQELVDDPFVLFLDEPTTGLDAASATLCIKLLKTLALEGKTVVCTIHTPSALIFKQFDHLYALAAGKCIYQGSSLNLIPFLNELGLVCPESYNPSDFLVEIANGEYGPQNDFLTEKIMNGENENFRREESSHVICEVFDMTPSKGSLVSSNFIEQLWYLMIRNFLIIYRDKMIMWLRLAIHIVVGLSVGAFFVNVGPEASKIFSNFKMIYATTMFLMYTGFYSSVTRFSLEMPTTSREHFNKYYSSGAYYWAMSLTDIPLTVVCTTIFVQIVFTMTGQPNQPGDEFRFTMLLSLQIFVSFLACGFGQMIGSIFTLMGSLFFASVFLPIFLLFGGFMITQKDANSFFSWVFELCFVKQAGDSGLSTILGYNRTKLNCADELYCHFQQPKKFLEAVGVEDQITYHALANLLFFFVLFRAVAFYMINSRLRH